MPDVALTVAESDCTDLTRMEGPGIVVEAEAAATAAVAAARHVPSGRRLMFRALLCRESAGDGQIGVVASTFGRVGRLPAGVARRYVDVVAELARHGRQGVCSGYLLGGPGPVEVRLLLHEPDECLRRLEIDLLERSPQADARGVPLPR